MSVEIAVSEITSGISIKAEELLKLLEEKKGEIKEAIEKVSKEHLNIYLNFNELQAYSNVTELVKDKIDMNSLDLPEKFELCFYSNYLEEPYIEIIGK